MKELFTLSQMTPTLFAACLASLEEIVNEALRLDAASSGKLSKFEDCWLQLNISPLADNLYVGAGYPVRLTAELTGDPDATISGSPVALLRFWQHAEISPELVITGNQSLAEQLARISSQLDIDWEALLAEHIGNLPAHFISERTREVQRWLDYMQRHFFKDAEEYLHHESKAVPDHEEIKLWKENIAELARATDGLESRLQNLERGLHPSSATLSNQPINHRKKEA